VRLEVALPLGVPSGRGHPRRRSPRLTTAAGVRPKLLLNPLPDLPGQLERLVEVRELMR